MQRRFFLSSLLSLAAVPGAFTAHSAAEAGSVSAAPRRQLVSQLQRIHDQLLGLAPHRAPEHPAAEAVALSGETLSRLRRDLPVPPGLWQNLADSILRTQNSLSVSMGSDLAPLIAQEIRRLVS